MLDILVDTFSSSLFNLFTSNPNLIDRDVKREMIKLRAERESSEKYSHMKLKDLMAKKS